MYKYQNVSNVEQVVMAEGEVNPRVVPAGATTVSSVAIENPNFKYIGEDQSESSSIQSVDTAMQPGAVTDATLVNNENTEEIQ